MAGRNPVAGGFFILVGIIAGAAAGLADGNMMPGVLIGTACGIIAAFVIWLADRGRR